MKKTKAKSKRKTVRGPRLGLKFQRTPRLRFIEPPMHSDGNPFFAFRVPSALLSAFKAHAKKKNLAASAMVRAYMSKVTGVKREEEGDNG